MSYILPFRQNKITIGPLIDIYGSYITQGTVQAMIMDSEGKIWNNSAWQSGTYWFDLSPDSNPGFWYFNWTPNKSDIFWILYYINAGTLWTGYMLETYIGASLFTYEQFTSITPKSCFIRLFNLSGEPAMGKVVEVNLDGVKKDINGVIIYNLPQRCATDEQGYAFFFLIPQDQIQGDSRYILTVDSSTYSFVINSSDTEPINLGAKI